MVTINEFGLNLYQKSNCTIAPGTIQYLDLNNYVSSQKNSNTVKCKLCKNVVTTGEWEQSIFKAICCYSEYCVPVKITSWFLVLKIWVYIEGTLRFTVQYVFGSTQPDTEVFDYHSLVPSKCKMKVECVEHKNPKYPLKHFLQIGSNFLSINAAMNTVN